VLVGKVRATAPATLGRDYVVPAVVEFLAAHPRAAVELDLDDRYADLVERRLDVALRVGRRLSSSTLVARRIAEVRVLVCGSPEYLDQRGVPSSPSDLSRHEWVVHGTRADVEPMTFRRGRRAVKVKPASGRFACLDGAATVAAAAAGHGLVVAPEFELQNEVTRGRLVPVLGGWELDRFILSAVYPPRRHASAQVRTFVTSSRRSGGARPGASEGSLPDASTSRRAASLLARQLGGGATCIRCIA
jgi:DNA-binding transcriptional LysR family regulator